MKSGKDFATCALLSKWDTYTYDQLDCQAFVEKVLKDIGIRKPDGSVYNWRGSNSMYRNYYTWRGTIDECIKKFGTVPPGAFVYIWEPAGEETGYNDGLGNCKHVGIYCGNNVVRDSTRSTKSKRNGVGSRPLSDFNRVSLFAGLDYFNSGSYNDGEKDFSVILAGIQNIRNELKRMEECIYELSGN